MSTQAALVTHVDFMFIPVKDFEAAREFYGDVLGLPMAKRYGKMPGGEFETGNLTLQIIQADQFGIEFNRSPNPLALHVDDVEAARAELESRGVEFIGETIDS